GCRRAARAPSGRGRSERTLATRPRDVTQDASRAGDADSGGAAGSNGSGGDSRSRRSLRREMLALGDASSRILQEDDFDSVCRLFLDAIREHTLYRRAVLALFDEDGRDVQLFFTGFTDEEIDYFH